MLIYSQNKSLVYDADTIQVGKANPELETEDQNYCIIGYNLKHSEQGFVLGEYPTKDLAIEALGELVVQIEDGRKILDLH